LAVGSTTVEASLNGISGKSTVVIDPMALVTYFSDSLVLPDTTLRIGGASGAGPETCAMLYVFNQDQQMAECCGCQISMEGLRTLSLNKNLLSNPLTGVRPLTGTVLFITADYKGNTACNPSAVTPTGFGIAWATHIHASGTSVFASESSLTQTELGGSLRECTGSVQFHPATRERPRYLHMWNR
jgi:hypothetical protein